MTTPSKENYLDRFIPSRSNAKWKTSSLEVCFTSILNAYSSLLATLLAVYFKQIKYPITVMELKAAQLPMLQTQVEQEQQTARIQIVFNN